MPHECNPDALKPSSLHCQSLFYRGALCRARIASAILKLFSNPRISHARLQVFLRALLARRETDVLHMGCFRRRATSNAERNLKWAVGHVSRTCSGKTAEPV